jgi:hypothetical protein
MLSSFGIGAVFIGVVLAVEVVGIVSVPVPVVVVVEVLVESVVLLLVVLSLHDHKVAAIKIADKAKKLFFINEYL